jgi:quinol monooxygenase YgiN
MIIVSGYIVVRAEDTEQFAPRVAVHCDVVRACDGCLQYAIAADMGEPGKWWVIERWRDAAAQAAHLASDHMAHFNVLMNRMKMSSGRIESFHTDDPGRWLIRS